MRISDWSSDVCSSDLSRSGHRDRRARLPARRPHPAQADRGLGPTGPPDRGVVANGRGVPAPCATAHRYGRSEEHTSELQSLMRISYAAFCLKKQMLIITLYTTCNNNVNKTTTHITH